MILTLGFSIFFFLDKGQRRILVGAKGQREKPNSKYNLHNAGETSAQVLVLRACIGQIEIFSNAKIGLWATYRRPLHQLDTKTLYIHKISRSRMV